MAISEGVRKAIRARAGGQCECTMKGCGHKGRCTRGLVAPYWDAHHLRAGGPDIPSNLLAMCATCHKNTRTYGRNK